MSPASPLEKFDKDAKRSDLVRKYIEDIKTYNLTARQLNRLIDWVSEEC